MARPLGRDHEDVHIGRRDDLFEMDVEAVSTGQAGPRPQPGFDIGLIHFAGHLVRGQNHDDIGLFGRLGDLLDQKTGAFGLGPRAAARLEGDPHVHAAVTQVERVGVALAAVADNGDLLVLEQGQVGVFVVVNIHAAFSLWIFRLLSSSVSPPLAADNTCTPRWMATLPVRTTSRTPSGLSSSRMAVILPSSPVTSMT